MSSITVNLALAIEHSRWEAAALFLALGVVRAAGRLSPEGIQALREMLDGATLVASVSRGPA